MGFKAGVPTVKLDYVSKGVKRSIDDRLPKDRIGMNYFTFNF
jgi:hypothetical protein